MKITAEYKGKQVTFDVPDETLDKLIEEPKKKTGWEKPERGQWYWYIDHQGIVQRSCWSNENVDLVRYDCGNCFTSKELAENIARYKSLDRRIRRRIAEICEPVDLCNPNADKYTFYYDDAFHEMRWTRHIGIHFAAWYCDTEANVYKIIEEFKDELTWYFTEFKDRMDG